MLSQTGWLIREGRMNPDPNLSYILQGENLGGIKTLSLGKLKLEGLNPMDVLELMAVQFFIRAEPAPQNHS